MLSAVPIFPDTSHFPVRQTPPSTCRRPALPKIPHSVFRGPIPNLKLIDSVKCLKLFFFVPISLFLTSCSFLSAFERYYLTCRLLRSLQEPAGSEACAGGGAGGVTPVHLHSGCLMFLTAQRACLPVCETSPFPAQQLRKCQSHSLKAPLALPA